MYDAAGEQYIRGDQTGRGIDVRVEVYCAIVIASFDPLATCDVCVGRIVE